MCYDLSIDQRPATKDDIHEEFVVSVDGDALRENRGRAPGAQKPVFMIRRRDDLSTVFFAREANILSPVRMVHNALHPLPVTGTVAWVETAGPIMCIVTGQDGVDAIIALNPGVPLPKQEKTEFVEAYNGRWPVVDSYSMGARSTISGRTSVAAIEGLFWDRMSRAIRDLDTDNYSTPEPQESKQSIVIPKVKVHIAKSRGSENSGRIVIDEGWLTRVSEPRVVVDERERIKAQQMVRALGLY